VQAESLLPVDVAPNAGRSQAAPETRFQVALLTLLMERQGHLGAGPLQMQLELLMSQILQDAPPQMQLLNLEVVPLPTL